MMQISFCTRLSRVFRNASLHYTNLIFNHSFSSILWSLCGVLVLCCGLLVEDQLWVPGTRYQYLSKTLIEKSYDAVYRSTFKDNLCEELVVLLDASDRTTAVNILDPNIVSSILLFDKFIRSLSVNVSRPFDMLLLPKKEVAYGVYDASKSMTFQDICCSSAALECEPTSDGLLDLLEDNLVRQNATETANSHKQEPIQLPSINELLVDLQREHLIPLHRVLARLRVATCVVPIHGSVLNNLIVKAFPNAFYRPYRYWFESYPSQASLPCVYEAKVILLRYKLKANTTVLNDIWTENVRRITREFRRWGPLKVHIRTPNDEEKALGDQATLRKEIMLGISVMVALLVYLIFVDFLTHRDIQRITIIILGGVCAFLSFASAFAINCFLRIPIVPPALLAACVVFFLGLAHSFLLLHLFSCSQPLCNLPLQRCHLVAIHGGSRVLCSGVALTLTLYLLQWQSSTFVKSFSAYCVTGIVTHLVLCFTFFFPILVLKAKYEKPCPTDCTMHELSVTLEQINVDDEIISFPALFKIARGEASCTSEWEEPPLSKYFVESSKMKLCSPSTYETPQQVETDTTNCVVRKSSVNKRNWITRFISILFRPIPRAIILIDGGIILLTVVIYSFLTQTTDFQLLEVMPATSDVAHFHRLSTLYFNRYSEPTDIVFLSQMTPWWSSEFKSLVEEFEAKLLDQHLASYIIDPLLAIVRDRNYTTWMTSGSRTVFLSVLKDVVNTPESSYHQFRRFFIWKDDHLVAWKMVIFPPFHRTRAQRSTWISNIRHLAAEYKRFDDPFPKNASSTFAFNQERRNKSTVDNNTCRTTTGTGILLMTHLGDIARKSSQFSMLSLHLLFAVSGTMSLLGWMALMDIPLNGISSSFFLFALSLICCFVRIFTSNFQSFREMSPTKNFAIMDAIFLETMPIIHMVGGTVLVYSLFLMSEVYTTRIFTQIFLSALVFFVLYGMVFLPLLMTLNLRC